MATGIRQHRLALVAALVCAAALLTPTVATAQTAAAVEVDPPVVKFSELEGDPPLIATYDVVVRASSDQPKDRYHVWLFFCDDSGSCEQVASVTDFSAGDPRTTQTWPDPTRGVQELKVRLLPSQRGTLHATWEIYTMHEYAFEGTKTYDSQPVPIGSAPGHGGTGEPGGGRGPGGGGKERGPSIRIGKRNIRRGLPVDIACARACSATARVVVSRRVARRLGLPSRVLARVETRLARAGRRRAWLQPSRRVARRLEAAGTRALARGRVVDAAGRRGSARVRAVLQRR
jgi:hypothetical protein